MKILFLSQIVPYPPHGGVFQRGYNLIREIRKYDKIHLMAFIHPDILSEDKMVRESREVLGNFCEQIEYFDLWPKKSRYYFYKTITLSLFNQNPFSVLAHRSQQFKQRVREIITSDKIDIVHADTIALAQFVDGVRNVPKVLTHHNIESQLMERRAEVEKSPLTRIYLSQQAKKLRSYEIAESPKFNTNIMMSQIDAQRLRQMVPGIKTSVVVNGVDTEYFSPKSGHESPALIYIGGMNIFANKDAILYFLKEIWPLVKTRMPKVRFFAVGKNPPSQLLEMSNKDPQIQVAGYVDDVRPFLAKASVFIVPLRIGGGTRLKILDAMAMGKAVVSTSIGCEGIDVTPDKNILIADEPAVFAEKTLDLLNNPQKRAELGRAGRQLVESTYSWGIIGHKLHGIYEEVLKRSKLSKSPDH